MAADSFIGLLKHPIAIALWLCVMVMASVITYRSNPDSPPITPVRLVKAYVAAFIACMALSAYFAYVSPEEAAAVWHVGPEHYREAIIREFTDNLTISVFIAGLGIALVGVPVIFRLARVGRAQVGWILVASTGVSTVFTLALSVFFLMSNISWGSQFLTLLVPSLGAHLLLALCFSVGAGIPWRAPSAVT